LKPAVLALEDGTVFEGSSFGAPVERTGEVVFNTSLTGYQEIFTDPSYSGQIVVLTNPQIGNYGATKLDNEAIRPFIEGLVVREFSPLSSNWRADETADHFLSRQGVPIISGIDTRALVLHLRSRGVMRGVLSTLSTDKEELVRKAKAAPSMAGLDLATIVSTKERYTWNEPVAGCSPSERFENRDQKFHVVAYDFGIKRNILRRLAHSGCHMTVVPAGTSAKDVLALKPNGVFLSNGPGDPEPLLDGPAKEIQKLIGKVPMFGICLGHQVLGLALGGRTFKLKFGHRGGNHPVLNKLTGRVEITAQNHGFCVDPDSLNANELEVTHINLNDQTLEGFRHKNHPLFCVQYHPEAAPGPHDSVYLFDDFIKLMEESK
jgi:carbamoyl-phosphate synthase small subunit